MTSRRAGCNHSLDELYSRPGFMLRRAHQISVALFLEETAGLGLTTAQFGVMVALRARETLSQAGVAKVVGIDRSTSALVIGKLECMGYVTRGHADHDQRNKLVSLTPAGHAVLKRIAEPAQRARDRAMSAFSRRDAACFLRLLEQFVTSFNPLTRAPIPGNFG